MILIIIIIDNNTSDFVLFFRLWMHKKNIYIITLTTNMAEENKKSNI